MEIGLKKRAPSKAEAGSSADADGWTVVGTKVGVGLFFLPARHNIAFSLPDTSAVLLLE